MFNYITNVASGPSSTAHNRNYIGHTSHDRMLVMLPAMREDEAFLQINVFFRAI